MQARRGIRIALLLLWLIGVAVYATWPLTRYMASRVPIDLADPLQNTWIFAWTAHALAHQPLHLFDAPIFHPVTLSLAFAENMIGLAVPVAPVFWLSHNALLTANVAILIYLALGGLATGVLVLELGGSWLPALAAGTAVTALPYRVAAVGHIHVVGVYLVPVALLLLLRIERHDRGATAWRPAAGLAAVVGVQCWSSLTGAVVLLCAAGAWVLMVTLRQRRAALAFLVRSGAAILAGVVLALPVLVPYVIVRHRYPDDRQPSSEVIAYSATPGSYLADLPGPGLLGPRVHHRLVRWSAQPSAEQHLFPGVPVVLGVALAIGGVTVVAVRRRSVPERLRPALAVGGTLALTGFVLSMGPHYGRRPDGVVLPFAVLEKLAGGLTRVPARFGVLVPLGLVVIVGAALAELSPRLCRLLSVAFIVFTLAEARPVRMTMLVPAPITAAHRAVARRPGTVLALPTGDLTPGGQTGAGVLFEAQNEYLATAHFRPMLNGYSSYYPPSYREGLSRLLSLPSVESFAFLGSRGVTTLIVQGNLVVGTPWERAANALGSWPGVRVVARGENVVVYDVREATRSASLLDLDRRP